MSSDLIHQSTQLMREQAAAYHRLNSATAQLAGALVRGVPETIDSLVRAGQSELLKMRARLVQIITALGQFAEARAQQQSDAGEASQANRQGLPPDIRREFEAASTELMEAARQFQQTHDRANALAAIGTSFASACIEVCGVPPTTYRAPYTRREEERPWA